jgi:UDP-N-acetylmuramoyl-L-alanyl-D-glutamate--2,6-diaminopimelate ligase
VSRDDEHGRRLLGGDGPTDPAPLVDYGIDDAEDLVVSAAGSTFRWRGRRVELPLVGRFNVLNALAAATAADRLGVEPDVVASGLAAAPQVPGRFERVAGDDGPVVVVDYAHTPDALETALATAREVVGDGRLIVVFGCGGDRDRDKRPAMGRIAEAAADVAIVTSDNPRGESPGAIASGIVGGMAVRPVVELDRRAAIAAALAQAEEGDLVLIAGKGHETTQTIGDRVLDFDDRTVARELLG